MKKYDNLCPSCGCRLRGYPFYLAVYYRCVAHGLFRAWAGKPPLEPLAPDSYEALYTTQEVPHLAMGLKEGT